MRPGRKCPANGKLFYQDTNTKDLTPILTRLLTPRECARLMGAGEFMINVPLNQALFGFGDAVCVPVIQWIATYYLNPVVNEMMRGRPLHLYKCEEEGQYDPARPGAARP